MTILAHPRPQVQPAFRIADVEPSRSPDVDGPFVPTLADELWLTAFSAARAGEPGRHPYGLDSHQGLRWSRGTSDGKRAREEDEAREVGRVAGLEESGASEPPSGYADHEKAAYRLGYREGLEEFEADREFEAWVESEESERAELAAAGRRITDFDVYAPGCAS